ncbi:MAG: ComEC/Rec2 family competence protein [Pseudomonadota bacterium]
MSLALTGRVHRSWIETQILEERDGGRFSLLLPALAIVGVWLVVAGVVAENPVTLGATLVALLALKTLAVRRERFTSLTPFAPVALGLAAVTAGAFAVSLQMEFSGTALLKRPMAATVVGRIVASQSLGPKKQRIVVAVEEGLREPMPRKVRVNVRSTERFPVGATVSVRARLMPLRGPVMPGAYDPARRLYFDGIGATGFAYGAPEILAPPDGGLGARIDAVRRLVVERIRAADGPASGFAVALLAGERGFLDEADVEALRASGLGHILAISGLHMALVAGTVFAFVRAALARIPRLALRFPIKKWAAVASLLAATFYLALSGASVATVRAYVMLLIGLLAILADRPAITMRSVAIAAALIIAIDPISALEPGFQMSFLAVVALVGAYEWWAAKRVRRKGLGRQPVVAFLVGLGATSLIAGFATAPAAAFHFQRLAPLGLLGNLAAMPVLTLVAMPAGVIALVLMPLGLEHWPLVVMGGALEVILFVAHKVAGWTGSAGVTGAMPTLSAVLAVAGIVWLSVMNAPWRLAGVIAILAGVALVPFAKHPDLVVADDGVSVAAIGPAGVHQLGPNTKDFPGSIILRALGDVREPRAAKHESCDAFGCTLPLPEGYVALPRSPRALLEDCRRAQVVATRGVVRRCAGPLVIDRNQLRAHGSMTATREDGGWHLVTARPQGNTRPWHLTPNVPWN